MRNQVICKFDLVRFNTDTEVTVTVGAGDYHLIQLINLKIKDLTQYRNLPHYDDSKYRLFFDAMDSVELALPVPAGAEMKFHDVDIPTWAKVYFRQPEAYVAKILGLDLANKADKKLAVQIAKSVVGYVRIDITKLVPGSFEIVPDPKSKVGASDRNKTGTLVGKQVTEADLEQGKIFLVSRNYVYNRDYRILQYRDDSGSYKQPVRGMCMTVLEAEVETPDERMPEFAAKRVKFLVTAGISANESFQTQIWTTSVPVGRNRVINHLIEPDNT
jgi:hypothetical protein